MTAAPCIFVVDDDAASREVLEEHLHQGLPGAQLEMFASGAELQAHPEPEKADLFIIDVKLGDCDGRQLVADLPPACHYIPVLFISGYAVDNGEGFDRVQALYTYDFISKPFSYYYLLNRVRLLLRFRAQFSTIVNERTEAEQGLVALFDVAPFLAVVLTEEMGIKYCNRQLGDFLGSEPRLLIGRSWLDFVPADQARLVANIHRQITRPDTAGAGDYQEFEGLVKRIDGRRQLVRWFYTPFEGPEGDCLTLDVGVPLAYRYSRDTRQFRAYWLREVLSHKTLIRTLRARLQQERTVNGANCEAPP